ncbi:MAG: hypothetical protein IPM91_01630 [Bacteroidetes bacterium]|nr:hypothetical protein [Bacteroidota bacterium]
MKTNSLRIRPDNLNSLAALENSINVNPNNYRTYYLLGLKKEKYVATIQLFEQAIKYKSNYAESYSGLAESYMKSGQIKKRSRFRKRRIC